MALWDVNGEIIYSDGALSVTPTEPGSLIVKRHFYHVPYSNVGKGGFIDLGKGKTHVPSWTVVHPGTTLDDIIVDKAPFEELFVEPDTWKFKSSSGDKEYTVRMNKKGNLSCDCWGYIAHKKCKHIKEVKEQL